MEVWQPAELLHGVAVAYKMDVIVGGKEGAMMMELRMRMVLYYVEHA